MGTQLLSAPKVSFRCCQDGCERSEAVSAWVQRYSSPNSLAHLYIYHCVTDRIRQVIEMRLRRDKEERGRLQNAGLVPQDVRFTVFLNTKFEFSLQLNIAEYILFIPINFLFFSFIKPLTIASILSEFDFSLLNKYMCPK